MVAKLKPIRTKPTKTQLKRIRTSDQIETHKNDCAPGGGALPLAKTPTYFFGGGNLPGHKTKTYVSGEGSPPQVVCRGNTKTNDQWSTTLCNWPTSTWTMCQSIRDTKLKHVRTSDPWWTICCNCPTIWTMNESIRHTKTIWQEMEACTSQWPVGFLQVLGMCSALVFFLFCGVLNATGDSFDGTYYQNI